MDHQGKGGLVFGDRESAVAFEDSNHFNEQKSRPDMRDRVAFAKAIVLAPASWRRKRHSAGNIRKCNKQRSARAFWHHLPCEKNARVFWTTASTSGQTNIVAVASPSLHVQIFHTRSQQASALASRPSTFSQHRRLVSTKHYRKRSRSLGDSNDADIAVDY
jgi:hypothetical protein